MDRRDFLMSTAVLTAGAAVRGFASPNDTVRIAVVGCGGRGSSHVSAWSAMPNVEIVALCDVDESHIAAKLKMLDEKGKNKPATYVDFRKLLEDKSIDAVSIATPEPLAYAPDHLGMPGRQGRLRREAVLAQRLRIAADRRRRTQVRPHRPAGQPEPFVTGAARSRPADGDRRVRRGLHGARPLLQVARHHRQDARLGGAPGRGLRPVDRAGAEARRSPRTASTTTGTGSGTPATAISATRGSTKSTSRAGAWA